jgi:hypothetical protein
MEALKHSSETLLTPSRDHQSRLILSYGLYMVTTFLQTISSSVCQPEHNTVVTVVPPATSCTQANADVVVAATVRFPV